MLKKFGINGYARTLKAGLNLYKQILEVQSPEHGNVELWKMEPDAFGNHYVVITRTGTQTKTRITLIKKVEG